MALSGQSLQPPNRPDAMQALSHSGCRQAASACPQAARRAQPHLSAAPRQQSSRQQGSSRRRSSKLQAAAPETAPTSQADVYEYEPQPLEEGVRKHMLSVFVADESGLINRVAGVFARRGANIESLAVGLTVDKALFTIVATGTDAVVANLCKQISKLVNVRYVEDITDEAHVERELILIKVHAPPGPTRTEVTQIAEIFRAHAVDVSDRTITLQTTGDLGKMEAFKKVLSKFGIVELVRTGRISLKRGDRMFDTGTWNPRATTRAQTAVQQQPLSSDDGDVYGAGNVLDAAYNVEAAEMAGEPYVLSIEVQDVPGVLNQVTGVFARRGYNVSSLAVGNSEREGMSRISIVVPASHSGIANLIKQLNKLVYVEKVHELTYVPHVSRELMMVKVNCTAQQRGELVSLASIFRAAVCDVSVNTITLEVTGKEDKMLALKEVLEPYGILEVARTGRVVMQRDSGVDTKFLGRVAGSRVML